jgi:hypothetical protein
MTRFAHQLPAIWTLRSALLAGFADAFVSYSLPGGHWVASVNGKNHFHRLQYQSLSWGGYKNSWEGAVTPPTTITFKLAYAY